MSRVLTDSLTHAYAECEKQNRHYVPSMAIFFQNKSFLFYKSKSIGRFPISTCVSKFCVFMHLWATDFRVYTVGPHALSDIFNGLSLLVIMCNLNTGSFPLGGKGSTLTCYAQHTYFSFSKPCDSFWTLSHVTGPTIEHQT